MITILYMLWPWFGNMFPKSWLLCAGYAGLKLGCVIVEGYLEVYKDICLLYKQKKIKRGKERGKHCENRNDRT